MKSVSRARLVVLGTLFAFLALGGLVAIRAADQRATDRAAPWTVQSEHLAVVREEEAPTKGAGAFAETRSTVRIWFVPSVGWRMEVASTGAHPRPLRIYGADGTTAWAFDPAANRYTLQPVDPSGMDPRTGLAVMMGTAHTDDLNGALAALRRLPDATVTVEGEEVVAGRKAVIVHRTPFGCWASSRATIDGQVSHERGCGGFTRSWLDAITGWVLRAEAENGRGGGYTWETPAATFDDAIDPALFRFDPPPGSVRVHQLD